MFEGTRKSKADKVASAEPRVATPEEAERIRQDTRATLARFQTLNTYANAMHLIAGSDARALTPGEWIRGWKNFKNVMEQTGRDPLAAVPEGFADFMRDENKYDIVGDKSIEG